MYNEYGIIGYLVIIFNILVLMISIGYFGIIAKDKTKNIKVETFKIIFSIFLLKSIVITLNFFSNKDDKNIYFKLIIQLSLLIITSVIYTIYIRVGQYLCNKNSLPGMNISCKNIFTKNIKYIFGPLAFLILWNMIFFSIFNIKSSDYLDQHIYNNIFSEISILITVCIIAPITEEIIYRHIFMSIIYDFFGKRSFVIIINIFITALIFSFAHIGILKNDLLKIVQIFPLGATLAYLNIKKGLKYSILTHILFNSSNFIIFFIIDIYWG